MTPEDNSTPPGNLLFAVLFTLFSAWLVLQIGSETKYSASGKLFAQPRFWPAVGVGGMLFFGLIHLLSSWHSREGSSAAEALTESVIWIRALEYLIWFMVYVFFVPLVGYLLATIIFTFLLCLRAGYRKPKQLVLAVGTGVAIVLIFKTGLSVKIPGGAVYEYLPDALRNFMIINF